MLYCSKCHYENEDGSVFCSKCGQKLNQPENKEAETELMLQAAYYYREGEVVAKDTNRAVEIYKKLLDMDNNNVRALNGLHWCFHNEEKPQENFKYWFPLVKKVADLGHVPSQVVVGDYFSETAENPNSLSSYREAFNWYKKAAGQNNTYALSCLAWKTLFCEDSGTQDQKEAVSYLEKGYALEPDNFAHELGKAYYIVKSESVKDYKKAMYYCKRGAANGDWQSAYLVGAMYEKGLGVEADIYNAYSWYNLAASHGDGDAIYRLGLIASQKDEYKINIPGDEAVSYLEKASDLSCAFCHSLMQIYQLGTYGTIDYDKASSYVRKSEEVRIKQHEDLVKPNADEQYRDNMIELRNIAYAKAVTLWDLASDNDIDGKKLQIEQFEKNIKEHSDLWSL